MTAPLQGHNPASASVQAPASPPAPFDLSPAQWRQVRESFDVVANSEQGYGEVAVLFVDGRARTIRRTISVRALPGAEFVMQLTELNARAARSGEGSVSMVIEKHQAKRVEISTDEPLIVEHIGGRV